MNDIKLIKKCQKGNKEAFNELISLYYPYIFKFLIKLTRNKELTEDLVQNTFMKMIVNIENYNTKSNALFSTYLITIAKNTYIDYLRKNNKELQELDIDSYSDKISSEYSWFKNNDYNFVMEKINELPIVQKEAIKLKYLEGYTLKEIAKIQKVESKTIKSRLFEGKRKLKEEMKGYDLYE